MIVWRSLLQVLNDREAKVVTLRLGLNGSQPKIQREIAELLGITRARAQQIEVGAIAKMQAAADETDGGPVHEQPLRNGRAGGRRTHSSYAALFERLTLPNGTSRCSLPT